jgi:hypothetical protein
MKIAGHRGIEGEKERNECRHRLRSVRPLQSCLLNSTVFGAGFCLSLTMM